MKNLTSFLFFLFSLSLLPAQAIKDIDELVSISFYERTTNTFTYTFGIESSELNTRLTPTLNASNNDFQGANGEYFDVFYSDEAGNFDPEGDHITTEAIWTRTIGGGGLNLIGVTLNFDDGTSVFTNHLASFFANGTNYSEGSEINAVDCNLETWSTLGNNSGISQRLRITVGVEKTYARIDDEICASDDFSITVDNTTYNKNNPSGREILQNSNGCDSIVFINLSFIEEVTTDFDYQGCQGDGFSQIINGNIYDQTNPAGTEILLSSKGCDSVVNVNLTFGESITTNFDYQGCQGDGFSQIINGNTYDQNNPVGTETLLSSAGCDSIVNLVLLFEDCLATQRDCTLFVPNAFSPNKDGINDCFSVYPNPACDLSSFSIKIFDRWGTLVFSSNDPNSCWEGRFNNAPAPVGTYVWLLDYTLAEQITQQESGNLNLMN